MHLHRRGNTGNKDVADMTSSRRSHSTPVAQPTSVEGKAGKDRSHGGHRCRIPRMMSPQSPASAIKETLGNDSVASQPRSTASRRKEQTSASLSPHAAQHPQSLRQTRSDKERPTLKRPSNLTKTSFARFRPPRTVINIPVTRDLKARSSSDHECQEVDPYLKIDLPEETNQDVSHEIMDDKKMEMKKNWQENIAKFENGKRQLSEQQRELLEIFSKLRSSYPEMVKSGQVAYLPSCDDLKIMNVSQLAPDQLLQLCAETLEKKQSGGIELATPSIDLDVLNEIPNRIIATCEQTLDGRKEIIDWFEDIVAKKVPNAGEWKKIETGFKTRWNFPLCYGSIDGKHVPIKAPPSSGSLYFNYKKTSSIVLLAVADHDYCFSYIDVGACGSASDGGVFKNSSIYRDLENNLLPHNGVIVGDAAFPLKTYLMKPYPGVNLSTEEKVFNYRLSRARRIIENAFGILVSRFRVLEKPIQTNLEAVDAIVCACCALHNWLRKRSTSYITTSCVDGEDQDGNYVPGSWRSQIHALQSIANQGSNHSPQIAREKRDLYKNMFMNEGSVPWQLSIIH